MNYPEFWNSFYFILNTSKISNCFNILFDRNYFINTSYKNAFFFSLKWFWGWVWTLGTMDRWNFLLWSNVFVEPWLVWRSGLGFAQWTKRSLVWFLVGACAWVGGLGEAANPINVSLAHRCFSPFHRPFPSL